MIFIRFFPEYNLKFLEILKNVSKIKTFVSELFRLSLYTISLMKVNGQVGAKKFFFENWMGLKRFLCTSTSTACNFTSKNDLCPRFWSKSENLV